MAEHSTVNRGTVGSSPSFPARKLWMYKTVNPQRRVVYSLTDNIQLLRDREMVNSLGS